MQKYNKNQLTYGANNDLAFSEQFYLEDEQKALVAMNYTVVKKDNFPSCVQYFDKII